MDPKVMNLESLVNEVRTLLERQKVIENLVSRQEGARQHLLQTLTERQHLAETQQRLASHHPADIAFVLQSLPVEDRLRVWTQVWPLRGGAILLELSSSVREGLLASMSREDLIKVLTQVESDDLSDLAEEVPRDILEEVYTSLDSQAKNWADLIHRISGWLHRTDDESENDYHTAGTHHPGSNRGAKDERIAAPGRCALRNRLTAYFNRHYSYYNITSNRFADASERSAFSGAGGFHAFSRCG